MNNLAPHLLAAIVARSDKSHPTEQIVTRLRQRFDVRALNSLRVIFTLENDPSITKELTFPEVYMRRSVVLGAGSSGEAYFTMFVVGNALTTLPKLDPDLFASAIAPVFLDGPNDELSTLLHRIASRYCHGGRGRQNISDFLWHHLGISKEAQDTARDAMSWDTTRAGESSLFPVARVVISDGIAPSSAVNQTLVGQIATQGARIVERFNDVLHGMMNIGTRRPAQKDIRPITTEQQDRG